MKVEAVLGLRLVDEEGWFCDMSMSKRNKNNNFIVLNQQNLPELFYLWPNSFKPNSISMYLANYEKAGS